MFLVVILALYTDSNIIIIIFCMESDAVASVTSIVFIELKRTYPVP